jgi:hypothetical protein
MMRPAPEKAAGFLLPFSGDASPLWRLLERLDGKRCSCRHIFRGDLRVADVYFRYARELLNLLGFLAQDREMSDADLENTVSGVAVTPKIK